MVPRTARCVRAPILAAPPPMREPMSIDEWRIAQGAQEKPVKGMLFSGAGDRE